MNNCYTYFLKWSKTGMKYYGARWSANASPSDLCTKYFTSSAYVHRYIEDNGLPDIIQIRKHFSNHIAVQQWENKVIRRLKAVQRPDFLNKNQGAKGWNPSDPEIRAKISKALTGRKMSDDFKRKCSDGAKRVKHTSEWNTNVAKALTGVKHTAKRKKALKAGHAKLPIVKCPHCNLSGKGPNMSRYHFNNCKTKPKNSPKLQNPYSEKNY